ncbi:hypothetical protein QTG54_014275 [Skeletonema marinoi]|uniref:Uncharacterized protein n=1 Tax=Skeletonema marinoi TaxID=267567 RepID=A0AAD9D705_9STRA|nr:hypothetical protein QTG54_014275 [Skeletonema marinoi]
MPIQGTLASISEGSSAGTMPHQLLHPAAAAAAPEAAAPEEEIDAQLNNYFNPDEDEKLFLATGYRYSFAHERGFPYPWCAKKHGRKGWVVRDRPPVTYVGTDAAASGYSHHYNSTNGTSVEFKGWKEAEKILHSRQILLKRFGLQANTLSGNQGATESNETAAQRAIDHWFQQTPFVMENQRTANQEAMELAVEKKRKREEVDLRRKQREELREIKTKEKLERKRQKCLEKQSHCRQDMLVEGANDITGTPNVVTGTPESPPIRNPSEQITVSSPSRTKRKGTHPKRDNKYRDIERSFIENQSLLLSPLKPNHDSNCLLSPSTPTPMRRTKASNTTNPLPYSPSKTKYKRTQPRKNQQSISQSSSIILGEDPLMDQMIEDIVMEFTTEGPSTQGHIFDGGAVSALREAAMDMVVHSREEKNRLASAEKSFAEHSPHPQLDLDLDDTLMERMVEQLIGEVAHDSGCNFEGDAVEALKMAAREIVTNGDDGAPMPAQDESTNQRAALDIGEGKTEETEGTSPKNSSHNYIQLLQLDNEDSNLSEIGGMIAQLVDDLGKDSDIQFDSSAVEALKKASRLV